MIDTINFRKLNIVLYKTLCYNTQGKLKIILLYRAQKEVNGMKKEIHPNYKTVTVKCACGNTFETGSVLDEIRVEICSECHPFFTGKQKFVDKGGRVDRFKKKYGME